MLQFCYSWRLPKIKWIKRISDKICVTEEYKLFISLISSTHQLLRKWPLISKMNLV
jgi:hypothetical protein